MKILLVHNRYRVRGGEDAVFDEEANLLAAHGHDVRLQVRDNRDIADRGVLRTAARSLWSGSTFRATQAQIREWRPDVVHVHNTFPLVSPSVHWASAAEGVPVVKTLHNFRLACLQGTFLRDGQPCEQCLGRSPLKGVIHRCYRDSAAQSAVLAAGIVGHKLAGTYRGRVARYIALSNSSVEKFVQAGLPRERIRVKPNAVAVPEMGTAVERRGGLYVGRISQEKGIALLGEALRQSRVTGFFVIGEGDAGSWLDGSLANPLGLLPSDEVYRRMAQASYLVLPSIGFEQFPRVIAEAFALGLPVIASARGALQDLVEPHRTGLLFEPGNAEALADCLRWAEAHPGALLQMGERCRQRYAAEFSPEINLSALLCIYQEAGASIA